MTIESSCSGFEKKTLRVLLLTSPAILKPATKVTTHPSSSLGNTELEDLIKILSAANISYDIKYSYDLKFESIISTGIIHYSTIILALPEKQLSVEAVQIIKKVSYDFGVSIVASCNRVGRRTMNLFGIDKIKGRKFSLPCTIAVNTQKFSDSRIEAKIKLGDGWKIPLQRWGLRRHPIRYLKTHVKKFRQQVFFYLKVDLLPQAENFATIKGTKDPAIVKYSFGKAINYFIALQSNFYLYRLNCLHRIVREIIRENSGWGMINVNLENTMVLRMDDPGTCERVYLKGWDTEILDKKDWQGIINLIKKYDSRLSVMYIPLWVDDGNLDNGRLYVKGKEITNRKGGEIYQSRDVKFVRNIGHDENRVYNYSEEFYALKDAVRSGWVEIEAHGLTHVDPDTDQWLAAKDRYDNIDWYHEFRHVCENRDVADAELSHIFSESAKKVEECFGVFPTAVTPSGHAQSENAETIAHAEGYKLFSSEYNSIKKNNLVIRNDKIKSIFFEAVSPDSSYVNAGYPVVGVFHDYDIVVRGLGWLEETINHWCESGINRFMTLRELSGYLCAFLSAHQDNNRLYFEIDISGTGNISNKPESRFFSKNPMVIEITIPKKKKLMSIEIEKSPWLNFRQNESKRLINLTLPPFGFKEKQEVTIIFDSNI